MTYEACEANNSNAIHISTEHKGISVGLRASFDA